MSDDADQFMAYTRNYFQREPPDPHGLKYRLDGSDVVRNVLNIIKGLKHDEKGRVYYDENAALMNETGVRAVEVYLQGTVHKINHLTKYKNEERIMSQMRGLAKEFLFELTLNMKAWGPTITITIPRKDYKVGYVPWNQDFLFIHKTTSGPDNTMILQVKTKVRNKHLILQVVENAMFTSMQRGSEGFEAELTGKSWQVSEHVNAPNPYGPSPAQPGILSRLFGGGRHG